MISPSVGPSPLSAFVACSAKEERRDNFHMMRDLFYGVSEQGKAGKHRMDDARAC